MRKQYETLELSFIWCVEDIVCASTFAEIEVDCDSFYNDGWAEA